VKQKPSPHRHLEHSATGSATPSRDHTNVRERSMGGAATKAAGKAAATAASSSGRSRFAQRSMGRVGANFSQSSDTRAESGDASRAYGSQTPAG
jgi:hypothetical protein